MVSVPPPTLPLSYTYPLTSIYTPLILYLPSTLRLPSLDPNLTLFPLPTLPLRVPPTLATVRLCTGGCAANLIAAACAEENELRSDLQGVAARLVPAMRTVMPSAELTGGKCGQEGDGVRPRPHPAFDRGPVCASAMSKTRLDIPLPPPVVQGSQ